jgi:UDP-N-acetylglucosamine 2-epimerase (non-hydrolysing)
MSIVIVAAARPNFMKVAPILAAFEAAGVPTTLVHTGQHYDHAMSESFFADLGMRSPDVHLGCAGSSHAETTARVMLAFDQVLNTHTPDAVVVVGDVDSTLACALVATKRQIPVAHVEAGLRSRDRSMPEEVNRLVVDTVSDWLLTPSADATSNLVAEGIDPGRVFWVGNVMVDSLLSTVRSLDVDEALDRFGLNRGEYALLTMHRPSNVDDPATLVRVLSAVAAATLGMPVIFPVHPRTARRLIEPDVAEVLASAPWIKCVEPLGYRDCVALQSAAAVVLTDSGGLQEETTVLGVPCLTLRESTERPVTVTHGTNTVVGTSAEMIVAGVRRALSGEVLAPRVPDGWDGKAAGRIVEVLCTVPAPLNSQRPLSSVETMIVKQDTVIPDHELSASDLL